MYLNLTEDIKKIEERLIKAMNHQSKIVSILKDITLSDDVDLLLYDAEEIQLCEYQKNHKISLNILKSSSTSLIAEAYRSKKIYFSQYIPFDLKYNIALDNPFNLKINSQIILPIVVDNQVIGVVRFSKSNYTYHDEDIEVILNISNILKEIFINLIDKSSSKKININRNCGFDVSVTYKTIDNIKKHLGRFTINNPEIQKLVNRLNEDVENLSSYIDSITSEKSIAHKKLTSTKARVLIADDVHMNVKILDAMIRQESIDDILFAYDGDQALNKIEHSIKNNNHINILFLDHHMPKKLGSEVVDQIRQNRDLKNKIFIISITNDPKSIEKQKVLYDYHIPKPFKKSDISCVIEEILHSNNFLEMHVAS
ncbi:MAG: response regulator [Campylobacterota bacterium]|nr:response regulator [Campylobacterota bacterium]